MSEDRTCRYCGDEIDDDNHTNAVFCGRECYADFVAENGPIGAAETRTPKEPPPIESAASWLARHPGVSGGMLLCGYRVRA